MAEHGQASRQYFGEPVSRDGEHELRAVGSEHGSFATFLRTTTDQDLLDFFRGIATELNDKHLEDFHFKIQNRFDHAARKPLPGWDIIVLYGSSNDRDGPIQVDQCMSCQLDCPLSLGVAGTASSEDLGPCSQDSLLKQDEHVRCWLDAKARPMLVVTPLKHVESMMQLDDSQLAGLWKAAAWCLDQTKTDNFISMILNHGNNRNHVHLHLKIRFSKWQFETATKFWTREWVDKLHKLRRFAESLPVEHRGTRQAYMQRQHNKRHQTDAAT